MDKIEQLIAGLSKDTQAVQPAPRPWLLGLKWLGAATAYLVVTLAISGTRPDLLLQFHKPWFVAEIVLLTGIFVSTALSAAILSFPDLHQQRRAAFAPVWMFALFALVLFFSWLADNPPSPLPVHSFECTINIFIFSLLPSAGIFYAMRQFASTHLRLSGIVAVLFAFSTGALWLRLHEQTDSIIHLIEWHYLPMIAVAALGWWLGKKLLKW
ncbi:MAG: DUF1109 domain-containing protein [Gammaproteobacteria bacterium]|nr:DUF1109 domain-containing protein [Gammaproteobacteria bacterium]MBU1482785.1 DUF1109 domain-containing protein [Gammaproteobacteria bacterium]